ncbi:MAG: hypothetical protein E7673_02115 [Ruminococcaceae bacterium]|nr:hypothetical protein [Oscillospiraceae bacterium]
MKKVTKIFILTLTLLFAIALPLNASAYAEEGEAENPSAASDAALPEEESGGNSFFEDVLSVFESNASEILSAFAFIGSLIIMLCYKKGLLPIVNDGLKSLRAGVMAIGEKSDSFTERATKLCDSIELRLEHTEKLTDTVLESIEKTRTELSELQKSSLENEKLKTILSAQIDMLYEIFMSASLPQYLKDNVGEKISEMKSALGKEAVE